MALNIKNDAVEELVASVAALTGESKTEAVRRSLEERRARLAIAAGAQDRAARIRRFLEEELWPLVPPEERGRRMSREEEDAILGYGADGV